MEADMLKMTVVVATTAILAFGVGVWTGTSVRAISTPAPAAATISPTELQLKIKPTELEVLQIDNYN
jgi:hypothetical protein